MHLKRTGNDELKSSRWLVAYARMMSDWLMVFFNYIAPSTFLSLQLSLSLSLSSSQPASLRYYCIEKTNRVAAKFRYKAKDVGQPPWLGWQGCQGDGGGKGRLDKGQCLMHAKCAPRTHFFMAAQLRGAAAERTKTMLPM